MDLYSIYIRYYTRATGAFVSADSWTCNSADQLLEDFQVMLDLEDAFRVTPCNIMLRKNGKLISYKDLMQ
ncbi:MAG: hypothetical protein ACRC6V_05470 [Bacteroidales bacterium]